MVRDHLRPFGFKLYTDSQKGSDRDVDHTPFEQSQINAIHLERSAKLDERNPAALSQCAHAITHQLQCLLM